MTQRNDREDLSPLRPMLALIRDGADADEGEMPSAIGALVATSSSRRARRTPGAAWVTRVLNAAADNKGLGGDRLGNTNGTGRAGHDEECTGETAAWREAAMKATGGFDAGGWLTGIVFFEVIIDGDAASAWNSSATGSRVTVGIGNVPLNLQKGLTYR